MREARESELRPNPPRRTPSGMQADIARKMTVQKKPGFFARLFSKRVSTKQSVHKSCCLVGVLMVLDRNLALDGLVMGISEKGVLFRQAAQYIFDRSGAEVSIRFGDHDRRGRISGVTPQGYFIQFTEPMSARDVMTILQTNGLPGSPKGN